MSTLQATLNVDSLSQALNLIKGLGYQLKPYNGLILAKTTNDVDSRNHKFGKLDLKGVIFKESDGTLVAPGCVVPLEANAEAEPDAGIRSITKARDGVLYRFYFNKDGFQASTSGRIKPNTGWGPSGCKTFIDLLADAEDQWDPEKLDKNCCYYAVLEHTDFTNVVKHPVTTLTLVNIINTSTLDHIDLQEDTGFVNHDTVTDIPVLPDSIPEEYRPLTEDDVGYNVVHNDGTIKRIESPLYLAAQKIKPNLPDPRQHWVNLYKRDNDNDVDNVDGSGAIDTYLMFYPWHTEMFDVMQRTYYDLVQTITHDFQFIVKHGWRNSHIAARNVNYMNELIRSNIDDSAGPVEIDEHLVTQDAQRIYYMMNPDNVAPKSRSVAGAGSLARQGLIAAQAFQPGLGMPETQTTMEI
jgi:hypothetical protein